MTLSPPSVLGTLETALYAEDLNAAEKFWSGIMGFEKIAAELGRHVFFRVAENPRPQMLLIFRPGASEKPLEAGAKLPVPPHGARGAGHFCLSVTPDELERWHDHLVAHDIEIEADFLWPDGSRSVYFRDPAGNSIELADPRLWA